MKVIKIFLMLVFSSCLAHSQCKQETTKTYQGQFLVFSNEFEYNSEGQLSKKRTIHSPINKTVFEESIIFTYNSNGKKIKEEYFLDSNKIKQINFQYDSNGKLSNEEELNNNRRISLVEYNGNSAIKKFYDQEDKVYLTEDIVSKDSLNFLRKTVKDENQKALLLFQNTYDQSGNLVEKKYADLKNKSEQIVRYSIDEGGKVHEESLWDNGKLVSKIETNYMPKKIIISNFDRNGNLQSEIERQLNSKHQIIFEVVKIAGQETQKTIYSYDNFGNKLLSKTLGPNGGELSREVRKYNCN